MPTALWCAKKRCGVADDPADNISSVRLHGVDDLRAEVLARLVIEQVQH